MGCWPILALVLAACLLGRPEAFEHWTWEARLFFIFGLSVVPSALAVHRAVKDARGVEMILHPDRYEVWRGETLQATAPWAQVVSFKPSLVRSSIVLAGGEEVPLYPIATDSAAYSQAVAWLMRHQGDPGWLTFCRTKRIHLTALLVAMMVGMPVIPRPNPDEFNWGHSLGFGAYGGVAIIAMMLAIMGWGRFQTLAKEPSIEPLVFDEGLLEPGVNYFHKVGPVTTHYRVDQGLLWVNGSDSYPLSEMTTEYRTESSTTTSALVHRYTNGQKWITVPVEELEKEGALQTRSALGNRLKGTLLAPTLLMLVLIAYAAGFAWATNDVLPSGFFVLLLLGAFGGLAKSRFGYQVEVHTDRFETFRGGVPQATVHYSEIEEVVPTVAGAWVITKSKDKVFLPEVWRSSAAYAQLRAGLLGFVNQSKRRSLAVGWTITVSILLAILIQMSQLDEHGRPSPLEMFWLCVGLGLFSGYIPPLSVFVSRARPLVVDEQLLAPGTYENSQGRYEVHREGLIAYEGDRIREFPHPPAQTSLDHGLCHLYRRGTESLRLYRGSLKKLD